ncbi:MAG TPA: hypothetical protein VGI11_07815 [Variovorax sp.]
MHSAPSVNYPVGRSRGAGRLLGLVWAFGAAGLLVACLQAGSLGWRHGLLGFAVLFAGAAASVGLRRCTEPADLGFDGRRWSISGRGPLRSAKARVALDLQSLLLVRLDESDRRRWIWLDRRLAPARWPDVRRAMHSRAAAVHDPRS